MLGERLARYRRLTMNDLERVVWKLGLYICGQATIAGRRIRPEGQERKQGVFLCFSFCNIEHAI